MWVEREGKSSAYVNSIRHETSFGQPIGTAFYWDTRQRVVTPYRRFGKARNVGKELPMYACVVSHKRAILIYFAAEA